MRLSDELGLRKILELPAAAKDDLNQVLRFEMDRLTPFRADEVCFAHRVLGSDAAAVGCRSSCSWRRSVRSSGCCKRRDVSGSPQPGSSWRAAPRAVTLNLLSGESGPRHADGRLSRALALLALVLAMGAGRDSAATPAGNRGGLRSQSERCPAEAEESLAMRDRLGVLTKARSLSWRTRPAAIGRPGAGRIDAPDTGPGAPLQLELRDQTVELHGFASTASDLIGLLEQSPLFKAPQFRAPVTQDRRSGAERFHISVELTSDEGG